MQQQHQLQAQHQQLQRQSQASMVSIHGAASVGESPNAASRGGSHPSTPQEHLTAAQHLQQQQQQQLQVLHKTVVLHSNALRLHLLCRIDPWLLAYLATTLCTGMPHCLYL